MQGGSVRGISIGYLPPKGGKVEMRSDGTRLLKEVRLMEVSVCPLPMAPRARITSAKSLADVELVLKSLRSEEMEDNLERLLEIDRELRRLLAGRDPEVEKAATLQQLQAFALELRKVAA